jgi:hypothetical protein
MNKSKVDGFSIQQSKPLGFFQPADAWGIIFIFIFVTVSLLGLGAFGARLLNNLYPLGAFLVGWRLYCCNPILYTGFVWWIFFLTPVIRRIADFNAGAFLNSSPILLAPYLAVIVCVYTLYLNLSKTREQRSIPFIIAIAAVAYGYLIGLINGGSAISVSVAFLEWVSPLLFAYHLYVNWNKFPEYCQNLQRVFLWGVLIMGAYGVYQYLVAPEWDRLWLIGSGMRSSAGAPEPFGIRVWSTMNSPGTFGVFMAAGLLILFSCQSVLVLPSVVFGALAFLLGMVRTAWIAWFLGIMLIITSIKPKQQFKLVLTIAILSALVIPLVTMEPFASTILNRLETLSDIGNDGSFNERQILYSLLLNDAITSYIGRGIGVYGGFDSAILVMLFDLGWIGSIPYVGGLMLTIFTIFRNPQKTKNIFTSIIRAIIIQSLFYLFAGASMKGASGMLLWPFLAMAMAETKYSTYSYYTSQLILKSKST